MLTCRFSCLLSLVLMLQTTRLQSQWQQTSAPKDPSGVYALTIHGNKIIAGISSWGVFESTDQGVSWEAKNDGLSNYSIRDFASIGANIFVATTGGGVFRSTESETSWTSASSGLNDFEVYALSAKGASLFAGNGGNLQAGVYRTNDSASSWVKKSSGLTTPASVRALVSNEQYIFVGVYGSGAGAGIFVSSDDGDAWTEANAGITNKYVWKLVLNGTHLFAGMDNGGGVYHSTDFGGNWEPTNSGMTDSIIQSFAISGNNIFAGTYTGGVFLSTDNGATWSGINEGLANKDVKALVADSEYLYAGTAGSGVGANGVWRRRLSELIPPLNITQHLRNGWNIISLPATVENAAKATLFPTAISSAFGYDGTYVVRDTLRNGGGYWLKFSGDQSVEIAGFPVTRETVIVQPGWNMIGSISETIAASSIMSLPPSIITTQFFDYQGFYKTTDSIRPGKGYWVKTNQTGKLILSSPPVALPRARIHISPTSDLPPNPPFGGTSSGEQIPATFALEQNYPNPFNPVTILKYSLPSDAHVNLTVYNMLGEVVAALVDEQQGAGFKSVSYDATGLPSGVYVYRISAGSFSDVKKLLFIK